MAGLFPANPTRDEKHSDVFGQLLANQKQTSYL